MRPKLIWLLGLLILFTTGAVCNISELMGLFGPSVQPDESAPDFTITTFQDETFTLSEQRGEIVVLNFWASWCGPCRLQAPALEAVWQKYRDRGVVVVAIAYTDTERGVRDFMAEQELTYPNGLDVGTRISEQYRITGVPETFIIDQEGRIVHHFVSSVSESDLEKLLDGMLDVP